MRKYLATACAVGMLAAGFSGGAQNQERVTRIADHDTETHVLVLVFLEYGFKDAEHPFTVYEQGKIVARRDLHAFVTRELSSGGVLVFACEIPANERGIFNLYSPMHRDKYCRQRWPGSYFVQNVRQSK